MKANAGIILISATLLAAGAQAESIMHGSTTINMEFVEIGYAGNDDDEAHDYGTLGGVRAFGGVNSSYRIGKYEVSIKQFMAVRAADSRVGSGNENFWNDGTRSIGSDAPASGVSWYEAATFANWLTTGDAYTGAYQFNGTGELIAVDRDAAVAAYGKVYALPTEDEWYKAAYFKSDGSGYTRYATGDSVPDAGAGGENYAGDYPYNTWSVGSGMTENNGTFDMNGNVWEWIESAADGSLDCMYEDRVVRGGASGTTEKPLASTWRLDFYAPTHDAYGFRIVAIPEPSSAVLIACIGGLGVFVRRRFPCV